VIRQAIHEFKYRNLKALAPLLAGLLHDYLSENPMPGELLVPVPLHSKRLNERGYNQGALLANELGRLTGLPVAGKYLVRQIYTPSQAKSAGVSERRVNVTGAFACHDGSVRNKRIIVVDDVSTSGATLNACAAALKQAGAAEVWGLVTALEL
jgi:ComF family protein